MPARHGVPGIGIPRSRCSLGMTTPLPTSPLSRLPSPFSRLPSPVSRFSGFRELFTGFRVGTVGASHAMVTHQSDKRSTEAVTLG